MHSVGDPSLLHMLIKGQMLTRPAARYCWWQRRYGDPAGLGRLSMGFSEVLFSFPATCSLLPAAPDLFTGTTTEP